MLKNSNDSRLKELKINHKFNLFYQLWKELTEIKTFDSYQYKSMNLLNGMEELIHDIEIYLEGISTDHCLNSCREELLNIVNSDYILKCKFPDIQNRMRQNLSQKPKSKGTLKTLRYQLRYSLNYLENEYDKNLIEVLSTEVKNGNFNHYIPLASQLVSRCVELGWSVNALSSKAKLFKNNYFNDNSIDRFLEILIKSNKQNFVVFFPFRLNVKTPKGIGKTNAQSRDYVFSQLNDFGVPITNSHTIIREFPNIDQKKVSDTDYLTVKVEAYDVYSASHIAISDLSSYLNILSFFSTIGSWNMNGTSWVVYNCDDPYTKKLTPNEIYGTYEYLDQSSTVYKRTKDLMLQNLSSRNILSQKLLSSFSYANLSRSSMALEEKYINMWVAIESLSRSDSFDNIISNIVVTVPNALCLRYIYRIVRNFIEDCDRCKIDLNFTTQKINTEDNNKEAIVTTMISIFHDKNLYNKLYNKCKVNSLLYYRCDELHKILSDEKALVQKIKNHNQKVVWQLNRLYRIRNEIAHSASSVKMSSIRYIEHLYDYLATFVSEIVRFTNLKNLQVQGEIFALINDNYKEFEYITGKKKVNNTELGKLWTSGIIDFI